MMEVSDFRASYGTVLGQRPMQLAFMYSVRDLRVKAPCEVERRTDDVDMMCRKVKEGSAVDDSSLCATAVSFFSIGRYSRCVHGPGCVV